MVTVVRYDHLIKADHEKKLVKTENKLCPRGAHKPLRRCCNETFISNQTKVFQNINPDLGDGSSRYPDTGQCPNVMDLSLCHCQLPVQVW